MTTNRQNKQPVVDRDFIHAELEYLLKECVDAGMGPGPFFLNLFEFAFSAIGATAPSIGHLLLTLGTSMTHGGELVMAMDQDMGQDDDHAGH
tara:strand:- start:521 stop:796 length:276 start_codon:yes stop_codon:yes gene_type:complete